MTVKVKRAALERRPSRKTLGELPARVVIFLRAVGTHGGVRAAMARGGFGHDDEREGWALLHAACAYRGEAIDPAVDLPARSAFRDAQAWVAAHWPRLRAALERLHPSELSLFDGLGAPAPERAVLALATLLRRIDERERSGSPALETLARRGLNAAERARLQRLVETAQAAPAPDAGLAIRSPRDVELDALYRWYADWCTTARAVVTRRDLLIVMGVVRRRAGEDAAEASTA